MSQRIAATLIASMLWAKLMRGASASDDLGGFGRARRRGRGGLRGLCLCLRSLCAVDDVGGNELLDELLHRAGFGVGGGIELVEAVPELILIKRNGAGDAYEPVFRFLKSFLRHKALLVELFARAKPRAFDLDVHVGLQAREDDEIAGEVIDTDGVSHIEDEYLTAAGIRARLQDEGDRFGYRHKIANYILMRHGDGAALGDLLFEEGDNASVRAEDVAEANGDEVGLAVPTERLYYHLAYTLGGAHYIRGVDRLIGRYLNEGASAELVRGAGDVERSEDVIFDRLVRAGFHQGDVLMRRRIENYLGAIELENAPYLIFIAHARDERQEFQIGELTFQLLLYIVGVIFIYIEDYQKLGVMRRYLAAKLASYRSAAARDEDGLPFYVAHYLVKIDVDGFSAE